MQFVVTLTPAYTCCKLSWLGLLWPALQGCQAANDMTTLLRMVSMHAAHALAQKHPDWYLL